MIEITDEKALSGRAEAWLDVSGSLTIVQDTTIEETEQTFIHLTAQQTRGLMRFLGRPWNREIALSNAREQAGYTEE